MKKIVLSIGLLYIGIFANYINAQGVKSFKHNEVKLLESPFYTAQQADMKYILAMDVDRLLVPYLLDAGIKPKAEIYPNWEQTGLGGHIGGHYLTALSLMYAATENIELKDRLDYMIDVLGECQTKNGNGYVGGIPDAKQMWEEIAKGNIDAGGFSLNKKWVPWYNIHKLYAGLKDAYVITGNTKALDILVKLSDWTIELTKNLTDEQMEQMLKCEHGGMNEVFVDVAEITGEDKYLELAKRFSHKAILNPLLAKENKLTGLHANTQIPKVIGYKRVAEHANDKAWEDASVFFWETVINDWTVTIGGNSVREHFHPADDFSSMVESNQGPETCNTYNMLKLTKLIYQTNPEVKYVDYYEQALYNHILSSEHPEKGGFVYMTPMRPRHYRVYSQPHEGFWCCVGSGLENHGKYNEMIYAHNEDDLFVNLFIPSVLNWEEKGIGIKQSTKFPYQEQTEILIKLKKPVKFNLKVRHPEWAGNNMVIKVNGKVIDSKSAPSSYAVITRKWKDGDKVEVSLPMTTRVKYLPDNSPWASIMHGPIVLAAKTEDTDLDGLFADDSRMGHVANGPYYPIDEAPMVVADEKDFSAKVEPVNQEKLTFSMDKIIYPAKDKGLVLEPFFGVHDSRYMIYFPVTTQQEVEMKLKEMKKKEDELIALENKTIDQVGTGEQQPESDHNYKGERTEAGIHKNKHWRHASGWFSYELKDPKLEAKILRVTYFGLDRDRTFDIILNGEVLATVTSDGSQGDVFFNVDYAIPQSYLDKNKDGIHLLKFEAHENSLAGGVYYIRLMREK